MAGVSLPGAEGVSETQLAIEVIKSRTFAREFINKHQILPELFAIDHWDAGSGNWSLTPIFMTSNQEVG